VLHPYGQIGAGADRDRQPEVEEAPGDHPEPGDAGRDAEADQRGRRHRLDDSEAARGERHRREHVGDSVGDKEVDGPGDVAVGSDEGPQRARVEQPVRSRPQNGVLQKLPVRCQRPQAGGEALDDAFHLVLGDPRQASCHRSQCSHGMGLAARQRQDESGKGGGQHGADDCDRDIGAVEAVQGDGDHERHPQHGIEDDGRADPLGGEGEAGIGPAHAAGGEQPVAEAGAAGGAAGDHVAHRQG